jgi:type I restriction enzyme S subunit
MPSDWRECTLGNAITLQRGFDLPIQDRKPGSVPVVSSSGITGTHSKAKMPGPGVVTGRYGTIGQVFYIKQDFWPLNTTLYVKDFKGNDPLFISYLLHTVDFESCSDKSSVPGVNRNHLHMVRVRVPPLTEQHAIAHILGTLDDKIELNRQMNKTLESIAQALFKSWFIDFDPVRARVEGRQPYGMDAETTDIFPVSLEDSVLGEIPKGWKVKNLPEAMDVNPVRSLAKGQLAPYLEMSNMPTFSARALGWKCREYTSGMKFINGDVLLARITPCLENGKTAYVDFLADGQVGWGSTEYIVLHCKSPLPQEYAYFLARSDDLRSYAIKNMTGTSGRQRVPSECFESYPIVVPSEKAAERFGEIAKSVMAAMKQLDEESSTLVAIRDTLLPKLLSGEIRVKDIEKVLEASA